jgi:maltose alpha-D-glucosyltransferase / alpha-amylase
MVSKKHNLWYKDAIIYQVHVQSFYDSNDDGIGDFTGLIQKLDYVNRWVSIQSGYCHFILLL